MAKSILICDDAAFMRMMIKDILVKNGYNIAGEAENGVKAVEKYQETKPDLVLMDITMPEMDGIQALKKIKAIDANASVVMCSAMGQQAMVIESIQSGARDFIVKPFQPDRVIEAVKKAVEQYVFWRNSYEWFIVKLILITVLVLVLAFYSTRLIAKYQNNTWSAKNNIQFIESYRVGGNKMVAIAKIGEKYFALGIGKEEIHVIAELKKDDLKLPDQMVDATVEKTPKMSFKEVLANMKGNAKDDNEKQVQK